MRNFILIMTVLLSLAVVGGSSRVLANSLDGQSSIDRIDRMFSDFIHAEIGRNLKEESSDRCVSLFRNLQTVQSDTNFGNYDKAQVLTVMGCRNWALTLDPAGVNKYLTVVLQFHALSFAQEFVEQLSQTHGEHHDASAKMALLHYYVKQSMWRSAAEILKNRNYSNFLSENLSNQYFLLEGFYFQNMRNHRRALQSFGSISSDSSHYGVAGLNRAIAYARQGWWGDAVITINSLLATVNDDSENSSSNRLLMVLGYIQLQNGFYRDAVATLGKIDFSSRYSDKALLGIGVAQLNLKEFSVAEDTFRKFIKVSRSPVRTVEAYLLLSYAKQRSGDMLAAKQSYQLAIFQMESVLESMENQDDSAGFDYDNFGPHKTSIRRLEEYQKLILLLAKEESSTGLMSDVKRLDETLKMSLLERSREAVENYLNQARYGLASLNGYQN